MKIKMAGIDHNSATLAQREIFAFSKTQAQNAMQIIKETYGVNGCVIISTCNRTELWICEDEEKPTNLMEALCRLKEVSFEEYRNLFTLREDLSAIRHLLETACGLNSQVWGEDQILTQIKLSIELARDTQTTNEVLEKLFQIAITCAKKIKSTVRLTPFDVSTATMALEKIKNHFPTLTDLKCLVLGNGEMGRTISSMLVRSGAQVKVTLREYKNKMCIVPEGCMAVNYESRRGEIKQADLIISATTSPHYTIRMEDVSECIADNKQRLFVDLAVPRDIDPHIAGYVNTLLIDIESLDGSRHPKMSNISLITAKKIIDKFMVEFLKWIMIRELLPAINNTNGIHSESISSKLKVKMMQWNLKEQVGSIFEEEVYSATTQAAGQILYAFHQIPKALKRTK